MAEEKKRIRLLLGRGKKLIPVGFGLLTVLACLFTFYAQPNAMRNVGNIIFDEFQKAAPREYEPAPVRVVDIDEESLEKLGQFPWPRIDFAELNLKLVRAGAGVVAYDIVFSEPDRTSPKNIAPVLLKNGLSFDQFDSISGLPDHDEILGNAFARTPTVAGYFLNYDADAGNPPLRASFAQAGETAIDQLPLYYGSTSNLPVIESDAAGAGFVSVAGIEGGTIRRAPLLSRIGDQMFPSLTLEALRVAQGASTIIVKSSAGNAELGGAGGGPALVSRIKVGNFEIPTSGQGELYVHYTRDVPERTVPAWRIIQGDLSFQEMKELFEGHIVLVGPSAAGLLDLRSTPLNPAEPGVLIHAQMLEQMILQKFLTYPYWSQIVQASIILFGGLVLTLLLSFLGAVRGGIVTVLAIGGLFYFSWYMYTEKQILFDATYPAAALILISLVTIISSFYLTESEKAEIRGAFDHYLSPDMVDKITDDPSLLSLGGEERDITILFCDVRSFSKISEALTPQELITFLNNFLTPMTEILMESKSTIDKYIGDAIMSFWNAPLNDPQHPANAARGSLKMIHALNEMNEQFRADPENAPLPVETHIGIGLNSGPCSVGNMGSTQRFAYSVLGDAVNLSSRLEGLTKQYKVHIMIGSATAEAIPEFAYVEVDQLRVVGREAPERIYTLVGEEDIAATEHFQKFAELQAAYLVAYRSQDWDRAEAIAAESRPYAEAYNIAGYYDVIQERINDYRDNPPGDDWDGIYRATSK